MYDSNAPTLLNPTADSDENAIEGCGSDPTDVLQSAFGPEWTSSLDANPRHVQVTAAPGTIDIQATATGEDGSEGLTHTLHQLLEQTPLGWNWSLDLATVKTFSLRFMDSLLSIGRHLQRRGGALAITGFLIPPDLEIFLDVFQTRCIEHHITLVMHDASQ